MLLLVKYASKKNLGILVYNGSQLKIAVIYIITINTPSVTKFQALLLS